MSSSNSYPFYLKHKLLPQPDIQKGTIEISDSGIKIISETNQTVLDKKYSELTKIKYTLTRFGIFMVIKTQDQSSTFKLNTVDDIKAIKADIASRPGAAQLQQSDNIKFNRIFYISVIAGLVICILVTIVITQLHPLR